MLTSLSLAPPRDAHTLWYQPNHRPPTPPSPPNPSQPQSNSNDLVQHRHNHHRSRNSRHHGQTRPTPLQVLQADETLLASRKASIRRFGSTWLRPPGVPKTYQAMLDEAAERAEQEAAAERERGLAEAMAAQRAAERQASLQAADDIGDTAALPTFDDGMDLDGMAVEIEDDGERDLDDDVPEADDASFSSGSTMDEDDESEAVIRIDDDEEEEEEEEEEGEEEETQDDGEEARDLDDDIPEAGSYQHTDTDVEDLTSDEEDRTGMFGRSEQRGIAQDSPSGPRFVQDFSQPPPPPSMTLQSAFERQENIESSPQIPEGDSSMMMMSSPSIDRGALRSGSPLPRRTIVRRPPAPPDWSSR